MIKLQHSLTNKNGKVFTDSPPAAASSLTKIKSLNKDVDVPEDADKDTDVPISTTDG